MRTTEFLHPAWQERPIPPMPPKEPSAETKQMLDVYSTFAEVWGTSCHQGEKTAGELLALK
ncbi:MAG: hypothetical protein R2865_05770 [Deinococcales bacterium]